MPQKSIVTTVAILAASIVVLAQPPAGPPPATPAPGAAPPLQPQAIRRSVKPGLYMITGAGANTTVRLTNQGLIVVDGKLPGQANYDAFDALIKRVSDKPIEIPHRHSSPCRSQREQSEVSGCRRASGRE